MSMKKFTQLMVILLILFFGSSVALAGKEPNNVMSTRIAFEDEVKAIAVQGDYGYVLHGDSLTTLNLSNPVSPHSLGTIPTQALTLAVEGKYAYTLNWSEMTIIDISNPYYPVQISSLGTGHSYQHSVAYYDDHVYFGGRGLSIVDVSDPKSPHEVSYFNRYLGEITKVIVAPDPTGESERVYAYLSTSWHYGGGGLIIVDVTDPNNPQHADPSCNDGCGITYFPETDLALLGQYAYMTWHDEGAPEYYGIVEWDVSDPSHAPIFVTHFHTPDTPTYKVAVQGEQVYVTGVAKNENDREVLITVDVAEKDMPRQAGLRDMAHDHGRGDIVTAGDCLYIPQGAAGLEILCESNVTPTPPQITFLPWLSWLGK